MLGAAHVTVGPAAAGSRGAMSARPAAAGAVGRGTVQPARDPARRCVVAGSRWPSSGAVRPGQRGPGGVVDVEVRVARAPERTPPGRPRIRGRGDRHWLRDRSGSPVHAVSREGWGRTSQRGRPVQRDSVAPLIGPAAGSDRHWNASGGFGAGSRARNTRQSWLQRDDTVQEEEEEQNRNEKRRLRKSKRVQVGDASQVRRMLLYLVAEVPGRHCSTGNFDPSRLVRATA
jgi:hypothetical protein